MSILSKLSKKILNLPRFSKRIMVIFLDIVLCIFSTWLAFYLRLEELVTINISIILAIEISIFLAIPIFWLMGMYKTIFRFAGLSITNKIFISSFIYLLFYFMVIGIYGIQGVPRSIGIIQPILLLLLIIGSRKIFKFFLLNNFYSKKKSINNNILIYGAGSAGRQLLSSVENNLEMEVVGFLDDNPQFHRQSVQGQTVYNPNTLEKLIKKK